MIAFLITYVCIFLIFFFWDIKTTKEEEKLLKEWILEEYERMDIRRCK